MAIKKATQTDLATKNIQESDLLDLWKYFQDRADKLKERQWTVGTWILTLLSGILAFSLLRLGFLQANLCQQLCWELLDYSFADMAIW